MVLAITRFFWIGIWTYRSPANLYVICVKCCMNSMYEEKDFWIVLAEHSSVCDTILLFKKTLWYTVAVCVFEMMTQYSKVFFEWILMIYNVSREIKKVKKRKVIRGKRMMQTYSCVWWPWKNVFDTYINASEATRWNSATNLLSKKAKLNDFA